MAELPGTKRGLKRKRHEKPTPEDIGVKVAGKLHHDLKEVRKAAKKAKAFEMQKVVKKLKDIRRKGDLTRESELEAQLDVLKHIDHESVANTAAKTKLKKDYLLSNDDHVMGTMATELSSNLLVPAAPGTPTAKVQNILLSSKIISTEVAIMLNDLKAALQPERKERHAGNEEEADEREVRPKKTPKVEASGVVHGVAGAKEAEEESGTDLGDEAIREDAGLGEEGGSGWESGTVADNDEAEVDGWESGSVDDDPSNGQPDLSSPDEDSSDEDDSADDDAIDDPPEKGRKQKASKATKAIESKAQPRTTSAQSTFLPSLSVGFTRGASDDSEWSDGEAKIADGEQKKNRRGQRARRAIWEKKFGKNANHMKKQREVKEASSRGRARHPAVAPSSRLVDKGNGNPAKRPFSANRRGKPEAPQHHQKVDSGWGQRVGHNFTSSAPAAPLPSTSVRPRHIEQKPLHPSWEAKKKQKEKQGTGILPAQGTKIKFS